MHTFQKWIPIAIAISWIFQGPHGFAWENLPIKWTSSVPQEARPGEFIPVSTAFVYHPFKKEWFHQVAYGVGSNSTPVSVAGVFNPNTQEIEWNTALPRKNDDGSYTPRQIAGVYNPRLGKVEWKSAPDICTEHIAPCHVPGSLAGVYNPIEKRVEWHFESPTLVLGPILKRPQAEKGPTSRCSYFPLAQVGYFNHETKKVEWHKKRGKLVKFSCGMDPNKSSRKQTTDYRHYVSMNGAILQNSDTISYFQYLEDLGLPTPVLNEEEKGIVLFNTVLEFLDRNLNRPTAPEDFRAAYSSIESKKDEIVSKIRSNPSQIERILQQYLGGMMSHLGFSKNTPAHFGFEYQALDDQTLEVTEVISGGPAEKAGVETKDIILKINGQTAATQILEVLNRHNDVIHFLVKKSQTQNTIEFFSRSIPAASLQQGVIGARSTHGEVFPNKIISVVPGSPADEVGLVPGDQFQVIFSEGETLADPKAFGPPGSRVTIRIKKWHGEELEKTLTLKNPAQLGQTFWKEIQLNSRKATYLRVPSFDQSYHAEIVHQAMVHAQLSQEQNLIIDLRSNPGGRTEHLLSYLLQENSPLVYSRGANIPISEYGIQKELIQYQVFGHNREYSPPLANPILKYLGVPIRPPFEPEFYTLEIASLSLHAIAKTYPSRISQLFSDPRSCTQQVDQFSEEMKDEIQRFLASTKNLQYYQKESRKSLREILSNQGQALNEIIQTRILPACHSVKPTAHLENAANYQEIYHSLQVWHRKTLELLDQWNFSIPSVQQRKVRIPSYDALKTQFTWRQLVKNPPLPFTGNVVFLVNSETFCAAEVCALIPLIFDQIRKNPEQFPLHSSKYQNHLHPKNIAVIGSTRGGTQAAQKRTLNWNNQSYTLRYPVYEILTPIQKMKIEGNGIQGIPPVEHPAHEHQGLDPQIAQAMQLLSTF